MKRRDILLLGDVTALAMIIMLMMRVFSHTGERVKISVDGTVIGEYPLDEENEVLIDGANGGFNRLVIRDGRADMVEADCPDKLCVHQAPVSRSGGSIVCLPHKVVVTIEGGKAEYDALTR